MSDITDVRCVLTQEALDAYCNKFHIPEEVHPVLPNQDDTLHERPARKIGLYTRFFDFSIFRLPLSTFLVDILTNFLINISQLSVIGAAKVSHFEILCRVYEIVYVDLFGFIHSMDATKVRVVERERDEDEPQLLETTVGRTVPLLPIAFYCAESELEESVDRLFNEGGTGHQTEQGDSAGGGQDVNIQPVSEAADTIVEDAAPVQLRRQGKRKFVVVDAGGASHPHKKLREDHGTLSGASVASVSTTPECEEEIILTPWLNRIFVLLGLREGSLSLQTSLIILKVVEPSMFGVGSSSGGGTHPITFYVPQWSVTNGSRLDDGRICREFAPSKFFASVREMKHDQIFTEFNVGAARQMSLSFEVRMRVEYNVKEKRRLKSVVESHGELLKAIEEEIGSLKAQLLLKEAEAAEAIRLRVEASNFKTVEKSLRDEENALRERNVILEKERDVLDVKVTELETSAMSKERELTDLNSLVTFVNSQNDSLVDQVHELEISSSGLQEKARWLLTHGIKLAIAKCLNSPEYLSALGTAIGEAIEKADYIFALQHLQNVNLPLLAELKSNKDASVKAIMEIIRLKDLVAEKLGLNELQPNVDQMMVPIHISLDKLSLVLLLCMEGTSGAMPTIATTLSTTLALTSTVNPIFIDDYEFVDADDQAVASGNAASFTNVDDTELHIPQ
nr:hypothetical protein [Tanacetum cinerariifolium]